jgi:hypothetical protein
VPVAIMIVTWLSGTWLISSRIAVSISRRGWERVPSQMEMATRWPVRTISRSGGRPSGARSAATIAVTGSATGHLNSGSMMVVQSDGTSTSRPPLP